LKQQILNPNPASAESARGDELAAGPARTLWYYIC